MAISLHGFMPSGFPDTDGGCKRFSCKGSWPFTV